MSMDGPLLEDEEVQALAQALTNAGEEHLTDENMRRLCDWATHVRVSQVLLKMMLNVPQAVRFNGWDETGQPTVENPIDFDPQASEEDWPEV